MPTWKIPTTGSGFVIPLCYPQVHNRLPGSYSTPCKKRAWEHLHIHVGAVAAKATYVKLNVRWLAEVRISQPKQPPNVPGIIQVKLPICAALKASAELT